jgi:hypothetical protein
MEIPGRIFIAAGKDVDSIIDSERKRQSAEADLRRMTTERDAAIQSAANLRAELENVYKKGGMALVILLVVVSIIGLLFWLSSKEPGTASPSPPPQSGQPPSAPRPETKPAETPTQPPARNAPSRHCMRGCGPSDYWEYRSSRFHSGPRYRHFECWRDRSIQGPCFD